MTYEKSLKISTRSIVRYATRPRAHVPIEGRLAARDGADREGGLGSWRGYGQVLEYLVFTYCSVLFIVWWDFQTHLYGKVML